MPSLRIIGRQRLRFCDNIAGIEIDPGNRPENAPQMLFEASPCAVKEGMHDQRQKRRIP